MHFFDSRKVEPGGIYYALRGQLDGHQFLEEVALRGGVEAVVEEGYMGLSYGLRLVRVKNVLDELHRRAALVKKPVVIGVTGSVGKTTTKEFIAELLKERYRVAKTPESYNSQISFPATVLNLQAADVWVMEMGMSYPGEIARLVQIAPPQIAAVTHIGLAHAGNFKNLTEISEAKGEIFTSDKTEWGVVTEQAAQFRAIMETGRAKRKVVALCIEGPFQADHLNENFGVAREVARLMGLTEEEILRASARLKMLKHRFHIFEREGVTFVDDSYNANPVSMLAALRNLPRASGKVIGVLGEMTELGAFSEESHKMVAKEALSRVNHVLLYGKGTQIMKNIFDQNRIPVEWFENRELLKQRLDTLACKGDVILIKGSNSNRLWEIC